MGVSPILLGDLSEVENHGSNFSVILLFLGQFSHFHGRKGLRAVGLRGQQPFGPWVCVTNDRGNNNPVGFRMFFLNGVK